MISSYRLGDLILLNLQPHEQEELLKDHPDSFGSKYILEKKKKNNCDNIDIITIIVLEYIDQNMELLPKDISESIVIHLRLGDVVAVHQLHEQAKRPLSIDYLKLLLKKNIRKKYIIGKCQFGCPSHSSTNNEECITLSNIYLKNAINELEEEHFDSGNADIDLCFSVKSKVFVQGKGFYSQLIVEIRKKLNLRCITTVTYDFAH
jgi:hypothetical protein